MILSSEQVKKIAVIGAGTMGRGIAHSAALAGFDTLLFDVNEKALSAALPMIEKNLEKAVAREIISAGDKTSALSKIVLENNLEKVTADVVIEAAVENLAVKKSIFKTLEEVNSEHVILATNTSSIPVSQIAADLKRPERVVGMHFFNPAHIMKLVEVISGEKTSKEAFEVIFALAEQMGKVPVRANDSPGFIVNRVARHFYTESLKAVEEERADPAVVDRLIEASGFKMGPFRLMDLIGIDVNYAVTQSMYASFNQAVRFKPSPVQKQKVDSGDLGKKSGKGFYDYTIRP